MTGSARIGTHSKGPSTRTIEQLLEDRRTVLGGDSSKNTFRLTVNPGGEPTKCVRTMSNCFDDCTVGIQNTSSSRDACLRRWMRAPGDRDNDLAFDEAHLLSNPTFHEALLTFSETSLFDG